MKWQTPCFWTISSPFQLPIFLAKAVICTFNKYIPYFPLNALPAESSTTCVPGPGAAPGRDSGGWPADCGCPGVLWRAGCLRLLLPLLLLLWNFQVHLDKFISHSLSEGVTIQTTIFKFYCNSKQTPLCFPFWKNTCIEKRRTG